MWRAELPRLGRRGRSGQGAAEDREEDHTLAFALMPIENKLTYDSLDAL